MAITLSQFLRLNLYNNTINDYFTFLVIFIGLYIAFRVFNSIILKKIKKLTKKTKNNWDDLLIDSLKEIKPFFYFILSLFISIKYLILPKIVHDIIYYLLIILFVYYVAKAISKTINLLTDKQIKKRQEQELGSESMIKIFAVIIKIIIWAVLILMLLSNMGIEITPLIASMGIGGIAIALALQTILGDLFGAFVIYFDKPFKEGDFIVIGADAGVVKHIGIKSTRIQALQGQEIVMSNTQLINSRVNNYKQMQKRRIAFSFGVTYDTGKTKLNKIKSIVTKVFDKIDGADLDRVHFKEFGDFSLNYEVVYYVGTPDYNIYMDIQEKVNLELYSKFEKEGIEFAFPTQTIELSKN